MLIGYARVSTDDQNTKLQIDALRRAGCKRIFEEKASGAKTDRPDLAKAMTIAREGDVLVVWKLDRLGRSLPHLIATIRGLGDQGVGFRSLTENIDTTSSGGKLVFHLFGAWPNSSGISFASEPTPASPRLARKGASVVADAS